MCETLRLVHSPFLPSSPAPAQFARAFPLDYASLPSDQRPGLLESGANQPSTAQAHGQLATRPAFTRSQLLSMDLDVQETDKAYILHADLPGLAKDQVQINLSPDNVLTIRGERKHEHVDEGAGKEGAGGKWRRVERSFGRFERSLKLPEGAVEPEHIQARMEHGVLTIEVPKKEPAPEKQARQIQIA